MPSKALTTEELNELLAEMSQRDAGAWPEEDPDAQEEPKEGDR